MASSWRLLLNGQPATDDLYIKLSGVEVEENIDEPGAIQLSLPVSTDGSGDLTFVNDDNFKPFANIAVVVTPDGGSTQCIFDGFVLSQKLHITTGIVASSLKVWGQDASWLMNLEEKAREWPNMTDTDVASSIFGDYNITPADDNSNEPVSYSDDTYSLMQRGSDIQFLRRLARTNGKICRVACADTPGQRSGYFAAPKLDGDPVVSFIMNDPDNWNIDALEIEYDVMRPTNITARQESFTDPDEDGFQGDATDSGLPLLDQRSLAAFTGKTMTLLLTTPAADAGELAMRARAVLREAGWFVRVQGEADAGKLNAILRVGTVVAIQGIGSLHSGNYYVWSVRHTISRDSHKMKFLLVRNAVGPSPAATGGLSGLLGAL